MGNILKLFQVKADLASVFSLDIWAPLRPRPHILEFAAADVFRKDFHKEAFKFCPIEFKCREDGPKVLGIVLGSLYLNPNRTGCGEVM